jgi:2-oxoglutarate dehydrogenase E2 component (dihydrolipoamide succinyltransferase)
LCEIETDKATLPFPAEVAGVLKILLPEGAEARVGDVLCQIDTSAAPSAAASTDNAAEPAPPPPSVAAPAAAAQTYATGHPSPAAQKLMNENSVAQGEVAGSGKDGRVTKQDVQQHLQSAPAPQAAAPAPQAAAPAPAPEKKPAAPEPSFPAPMSGSREQRREKMSRLRQKLSERLVAVKNETAMLTTFNEVDMSAVFKLRNEMKEKFEKKYGLRLGFMGFFSKAVCEALRDFPAVNAMIDGQEVIYHDYVDVGIAVSAPKGLVVPVVRNAESLTIPQIEAEISRLAKRARDNKLSVEEMTGGTFSITNGGVFGSMLSTPILNPPQSAILGMHNVVQRPIALNGEVVIRPVMYLALSYDHRVIDGRESVSFLFKVKEYLENPARMLLGV